jgi:hypothetical protein
MHNVLVYKTADSVPFRKSPTIPSAPLLAVHYTMGSSPSMSSNARYVCTYGDEDEDREATSFCFDCFSHTHLFTCFLFPPNESLE